MIIPVSQMKKQAVPKTCPESQSSLVVEVGCNPKTPAPDNPAGTPPSIWLCALIGEKHESN